MAKKTANRRERDYVSKEDAEKRVARALELLQDHLESEARGVLMDEFEVQERTAYLYVHRAKKQLFAAVADNARDLMAASITGATRCAQKAENVASCANEYAGAGNLYLRLAEAIAKFQPELFMTDEEMRRKLCDILVANAALFSKEQRTAIEGALRRA